jgi:hypothetical protein
VINDVIHAVWGMDTVKGVLRYRVGGLEASRLRFK